MYVADREADILELMRRASDLGTPADWLIRSQHDRALADGTKLWQRVTSSTLMGEIQFELACGHGQKARTVTQELRAQRVDSPAGTAGYSSLYDAPAQPASTHRFNRRSGS